VESAGTLAKEQELGKGVVLPLPNHRSALFSPQVEGKKTEDEYYRKK